MPHRVSSKFTTTVFEKRDARSPQLADFLGVYVQHYASEHRTRTNELIHFLEKQIEGRRIVYFGLLYDRQPCGFATLMHYPDYQIIIIDHCVIAPNMRGYGAFYALAEMIANYVNDRRLLFDHVLAEIIIRTGTGAEAARSQMLVRLLRQIGFKVAKVEYYAPDPSLVYNPRRCRAVLMLLSEPERDEIESSELLSIVDLIYNNHYLLWYAPIWKKKDLERYKRHASEALEAFRQRLGKDKVIPLNGLRNLDLHYISDPSPMPARGLLGYMLIIGVPATVTIVLALAQEPRVTIAAIIATVAAVVLFAVHPRLRRPLIELFRPKE